MKDNETIVNITPDGKYDWHFEPEELQAIRAKIDAITSVQRIHLEGLIKANEERKRRLQKIMSENWKEYDKLCLEYHKVLERFKNDTKNHLP